MIKGMVLEIKKKKLIVLTASGEYVMCKKPNVPVEIGQEINFPLSAIIDNRISLFQTPKLYGVIVACAMILFAIFGYNWNSDQAMAAAYVTINSKAKVKAIVNKHLEVIDVKYMDKTGKSVVQDLKGWKHQSIKSVVTDIIKISNEKNYLQKNETVTIQTKMKKQAVETRENLEQQLKEVQLENKDYQINVNKHTLNHHKDAPSKKSLNETNVKLSDLKLNCAKKKDPHNLAKVKIPPKQINTNKNLSNHKSQIKKVSNQKEKSINQPQIKLTNSDQQEKKKTSVNKEEHDDHSVKVNETQEYDKKEKNFTDNQFKYKYDHKHHKKYEDQKLEKEKSSEDKKRKADDQNQEDDE
jgi:hypothetical protein